tara:strand:- start:2171 stop:3085 length:915 start_codon:yes stop_codon:yes gene_type:complete
MIKIKNLQDAFGTEETFPESTKVLYDKLDLRYDSLDLEQETKLKEQITHEIESGFTKVGSHRDGIWESAWSEVRQKFIADGFKTETLNPNFISNHDFVRWNGKYIKPINKRFELSFFEIFRDWVFTTYLSDFRNVYEFGSGSGFNLIALSKKYPKKKMIGFDWSISATEILNDYRRVTNKDIKGALFDFFQPDYSIEIPTKTAVMTFCAFEQIGHKFTEMLNFFMQKKPDLIIQMEPTLEYYDYTSYFDQQAIQYHKSRNYLSGYLTRLHELENLNQIEIIHSKRLNFGNKYQESYSIHIWKPL